MVSEIPIKGVQGIVVPVRPADDGGSVDDAEDNNRCQNWHGSNCEHLESRSFGLGRR